MKKVRDFVGDGVFAAVTGIIAFVLFCAALWYDVDLTVVLDFNLRLLKAILYPLPSYVGRRLETLLRLGGFEHWAFLMELWFGVLIVLRIVLLGIQYVWMRAKLRFYNARWLHRHSRKRRSH